MTFYYDNQTREQAESLMEKQHYPIFDEAASEDEEEIERRDFEYQVLKDLDIEEN